MLTNYSVSIPPGGRTDAFVQTVISWNHEGVDFKTRGLDADQTEAAGPKVVARAEVAFNYPAPAAPSKVAAAPTAR